jgi:hypothetical integral membrane protein (TIGR02206 family)
MIALAHPERYGAALVTLVVCAGLCAAARYHPGRWTFVVARVLAVALVLNLVIWQIVTVRGGTWNSSGDLMVDLCPLANLVTAAALWSPGPLLVELAYFWACAGTIQGVLQPDARWSFPSYFYFQFYVDHSGVVAAALFLVVGLRMAPRPHAVWRVFALTVAFAGVAAVVDVLTDGNYMFLRGKGPAGTLLDVMGPWPWYIASAGGLALVLLLVLDAPFRLARRRAQRGTKAGLTLAAQGSVLEAAVPGAGGAK